MLPEVAQLALNSREKEGEDTQSTLSSPIHRDSQRDSKTYRRNGVEVAGKKFMPVYRRSDGGCAPLLPRWGLLLHVGGLQRGGETSKRLVGGETKAGDRRSVELSPEKGRKESCLGRRSFSRSPVFQQQQQDGQDRRRRRWPPEVGLKR